MSGTASGNVEPNQKKKWVGEGKGERVILKTKFGLVWRGCSSKGQEKRGENEKEKKKEE